MVAAKQVYQVCRKGRSQVFVAVGDVGDEVNVLAERFECGAIGRGRVCNEDGIGRFILIVLIHKVLAV
jgi:hypothetical protein